MIKKINKHNLLLIGVPIIVFTIVIILLISLFYRENHVNLNKEKNKFKEEYEKLNNVKDSDGNTYPEVNISSNNIIKYSYEQEILNIFNNKQDGVVYFGYPTCAYCRSSIEVLLNTTKKTKLNEIYYIDTEKIDISKELIDILGEELTTDGKITSSLVIFITDGEIVSYNKDTLSSHSNPYNKLNNSQKEGLSEIYMYGINDVISSKELKNN